MPPTLLSQGRSWWLRGGGSRLKYIISFCRSLDDGVEVVALRVSESRNKGDEIVPGFLLAMGMQVLGLIYIVA